MPIETQSSESWIQQSTEMYCQQVGEWSGGLEEGSEKSKGPSKQILGSERLMVSAQAIYKSGLGFSWVELRTWGHN